MTGMPPRLFAFSPAKRTCAVLVVCAFLWAVLSCSNPYGAGSSDKRGSLLISVGTGTGTGTGTEVTAQTLQPGIPTQITSYAISGSGPGASSFSVVVDSGESEFVRDELVTGTWSVEVQARNVDETVLMSGSRTVTVLGGRRVSAGIVLLPLEGDGTFRFELLWPDDEVAAPSVQARLEAAPSGDIDEDIGDLFDPLLDVPSGQDGQVYSGIWPTGYYILTVQLRDTQNQGWGWGNAYGVWILPDETTSTRVELSSDDFGPIARWQFSVGSGFTSSIWSSAALDGDGRILFGSDDGYLYALTASGTPDWQFKTDGRVFSSPAVDASGNIYFGSHDGFVYALSSSGEELWSVDTGDWVRSSPAIGADGTVYIGSNDGNLHALDPADGSTRPGLFPFATGGSVVSSPAVAADGTIFVGSESGTVYAVNPDGSERWSYETGDWVYSSPAIGTDGTVYIGSYDGTLYALNPETGADVWSYNAEDWVVSGPAVGPEGRVYVGTRGGLLHAVNAASGSGAWTFDAGQGGVYSTPAIGDDGTIYFGSFDRHLYAVSSSGDELWRAPVGLGGLYASPAIGPDGRLYIGSRDGTLYAFETQSNGPAASSWPMFGRDARRTARAQ